jgi:hypothetical protein
MTRHLPRSAQAHRDALTLRSVAQFDGNTPEPFDPASLDDAALAAEFERIRTRGQELAALDSLDTDQGTELAELASRVTSVQSELSARQTRAQERQAQRDAFAALEPLTAPQEPAPAPTPVVEPTTVQASTETAPAPVAPAAPVTVPSVSDMSAQVAIPTIKSTTIRAFVSTDAAGHVDKRPGQEFDGLTEISEALTASAAQYGRVGGGKGARHAIAQFHRSRDERLVVDDPRNGPAVLAFARDETRLTEGNLARTWQAQLDAGTASLTAAAGWCAPSENDYDLCRQWSAGVGILDLPSITLNRGGVNYTNDINFQQIYAAALSAGLTFLTEADVIADTPKTCIELPCPTFEEARLDVMALCIRVSFLQARGYPEVVNAWTDGLLAVFEQEMNRRIIADIIARAGASTVLNPTAGAQRDSWTSGLLSTVEMAAVDIRAQFMMSPDSTIEIVLPWWVPAQMRADLSRRNGVDMLSVTDAEIARMFSVRNVRVQFVRGWQDGLITGGALNAVYPGGDITPQYMTALPNDVSFLAYPAGSVVVGRQDVVTLTNVYDAASLQQNLFTSLFAEEGFTTLFPCEGQRLYTVDELCNMGPTGANALNCAVAV